VPSTDDCILVTGVTAVGRHGVLPEERERAQPFEVDLEIEAPLDLAGRRDDLADTVDYAEVIAGVVKIIETRSYQLLEALAGAIADEVLTHDLVSSVLVQVRKVRPPVPYDVRSVGVQLRRAKG
jgi:dihydroneopterin aldolase